MVHIYKCKTQSYAYNTEEDHIRSNTLKILQNLLGQKIGSQEFTHGNDLPRLKFSL